MKFIDADRLRAEIERMIHEISHPLKDGYEVQSIGKIEGLSELLEIINSLQQEQPKVDLEKEIDDWYNTMGIPVTTDALKETARHFYELGLNARKYALMAWIDEYKNYSSGPSWDLLKTHIETL